MPQTTQLTATECAEQVRITVSRVRRRLRETYDRQQLTPSQISLLSRLEQGGPSSASDLATAERVRPQSVATTLGILLERGLVERRPDPDDGRRQLVSLTAEGRAFVTGARSQGEHWLADGIAETCDPDQIALIAEAMRLLQRVADR
ncbi:DNA-binding MarR family transcriptional regulator [Friedmanniella endophytica]|uniref:DNA-binding MarR family transcriptional regulator n=1 Tax=Microlunatus kandeliicorticis TaxID=1759536 RepID=A0A7W3IVT9_9ACTN|nr:MarR family transcriptional regulator [Microlunatus kandeliicorticis]MBA8796191.1 DNA-binding MarR family transcriptional regulator [Microlunatus kandeliicorticis]